MTGQRQPDDTETVCAFHGWPAGAYGRLLTGGSDFRCWMVRKPCGCLVAIDPRVVDEHDNLTVTIVGENIGCQHGHAQVIERGVWRDA